jgi:predicted HicB family RNase H-like nuclease
MKNRTNKSSHLHIRIDDGLKKQVRQAAEKAGCGVSAWIRRTLEEAVRRELAK